MLISTATSARIGTVHVEKVSLIVGEQDTQHVSFERKKPAFQSFLLTVLRRKAHLAVAYHSCSVITAQRVLFPYVPQPIVLPVAPSTLLGVL